MLCAIGHYLYHRGRNTNECLHLHFIYTVTLCSSTKYSAHILSNVAIQLETVQNIKGRNHHPSSRNYLNIYSGKSTIQEVVELIVFLLSLLAEL